MEGFYKGSHKGSRISIRISVGVFEKGSTRALFGVYILA